MNVKRKLNKLWPVYLGEFCNPEHNAIKNDLLNYFDEYIKKNPNSKFIVGDGKQSFWSEIYENNKAIIDSNQIDDYKDIIWIKNYPNHRPYRVYNKKTHTIKYTWNNTFKAKKGEIFFTNQELDFSTNIYSEIRKKISNKKNFLSSLTVKNPRLQCYKIMCYVKLCNFYK